MTTCQEVRGDCELYALGALEPSLAEAVTAHLATCPACRVVVAKFVGIAHLLRFTVRLVNPSPGLQERLHVAMAVWEIERRHGPPT